MIAMKRHVGVCMEAVEVVREWSSKTRGALRTAACGCTTHLVRLHAADSLPFQGVAYATHVREDGCHSEHSERHGDKAV